MIDSYKNIERLRYRINKDLLMICADIKESTDEQRIMFFDECFSAVASSLAALFFTQATFESLKDFLQFLYHSIFQKSLSASVLSIIAAILSFTILLVISVQINKIMIGIKRRKRNRGPEGIDTIDYIKEFDNIACDSIIVSIEYKNMFGTTTNDDEKTLYFFESMHYLETASVITEKLCSNSNNIKSSKSVYGVDVYRVHNITAVMIDLWNFMFSQTMNLALDENDKNRVQAKLTEIKKRLNNINI